MVVELISVGTELLLGNIINTNAQFLAEKCALLGLSMHDQSVVGDNPQRLSECFRVALGRADLVILTGGLGPTEDDLTKEVCAQVLGCRLVEDESTKQHIKNYLTHISDAEIPNNNWKQALVPEGAAVLTNDNGTAPGLMIEKDGKTVLLLPGPPNELHPLFMNQVYPYLQKRQPEIIHSRVVKVCGIGESKVETLLLDLIQQQTNPTIAPYAKTGEVHLRITAQADNKETAEKLIKPLVREIKGRLREAIYTTKENETLEMVVVKLLQQHELTAATAESCTGGLLAARMINVAGVSDVFKEGFITYSNKAKKKTLDVKKQTLEIYGAVSEQTAAEMAQGGALAAHSNLCVSVTGIAGPDGGTDDKPVGLVYIACCLNEKIKTERYQFKGNRAKIREQAVVSALDLMRRSILECYR